jgi:hypothetical protein
MQDLKRILPPRTKIPKFQMAFTTPNINVKNTNWKTKACAFETEKKHSVEFLNILKQAYHNTPMFIQFQMKSKHPEAYLRAILQQTKVLSSHHVIILQNIGSDSAYYLEEYIKAEDGVIDMHPTSKTKDDGRHKVLVHKKQFHAVRATLMKKIPEWFDTHVEADAKRLNEKFPAAPEVAPISLDDISNGDGTYMSASVNSVMSYDTTKSDEFLNDTVLNIIDTSDKPLSRIVGQQPTWAQRVRRSSSTSRQSTKTPTVTTESQLTDDYTAELATSKAEVAELRDKLTVIEEAKKSQQYELELKAEKQRHELELQMAQQRIDMERQAELQRRELESQVAKQRSEMEQQVQQQRLEMEQQAQNQRLEFERKLDDQRREFERQALQQQAKLQEKITLQITEELRRRNTQGTTPEHPDIATFLANQTRQMQLLTDMFEQVVNAQPQRLRNTERAPPRQQECTSPKGQNPPQSQGKQGATHIVDLTTIDHYDSDRSMSEEGNFSSPDISV